MAKFYVSFPCTWSTYVDADSPKEAADIAECEVPRDVQIDGLAFVANDETGEEFEDI